MKKIMIIAPLLFACISITAQTGSINNILVQQRSDGSGLVDIRFDLSGNGISYDINLEVSFNGGTDFNPISASHLNCALNSVSPGTNKHVIWDGAASHPDTFADKVNVRIIAVESVTNGLSEGLVCYYPFNGNANDESGNGNHGMAYGPILTNDRFDYPNSAYSFDGIDDWIEILSSPSLNLTKITVSAWIKLDKDVAHYQARIINRQSTQGGAEAWGLQIFTENLNGNFLAFHANNGTQTRNIVSDRALDTNQWFHVVGLNDGQNLKLYINGYLDKEIESLGLVYENNPSNIRIGKTSPTSHFPFPGVIDDIRIYNRALSDKEIYDLYNQNHSYSNFTDPRDNITYKTVKIGTQTWMAENLAWLPSVVGPGTGNNTTPYHYVYGYNGTNVTEAKATADYQTYGALYNWPAALQACPAGWHLPTNAEWTTLENYLISNGYNYDGTTTGNKIAKSLATANGWINHSGVGNIGNTDYPGKRNVTGFSALPSGWRTMFSAFDYLGEYGGWWGSTELSSTGASGRGLGYDGGNLTRFVYGYKYGGFSVRCLRD